MKKLKLLSKVQKKLLSKIIIAVTVAAIICSCSAQWHLRKALQKDPGIIKSDTIVKIDTVYRQIARVDTVVSIREITETDTLQIVKYINRNIPGRRVYDTVKVYLSRQGDNLNVGVDCPDCPEITKETLIEKGYVKKAGFWKILGWAITGLIAGFICGTIYWKLIK